MYETTKLSIHEVSNVEWNIVTCRVMLRVLRQAIRAR